MTRFDEQARLLPSRVPTRWPFVRTDAHEHRDGRRFEERVHYPGMAPVGCVVKSSLVGQPSFDEAKFDFLFLEKLQMKSPF